MRKNIEAYLDSKGLNLTAVILNPICKARHNRSPFLPSRQTTASQASMQQHPIIAAEKVMTHEESLESSGLYLQRLAQGTN